MQFKIAHSATLLILLSSHGVILGMKALRLNSERDIIEYARANNIDGVQACIDRGELNTRGRSGHTALHEACIPENSDELVKLLLSYGAGYELKDQSGHTPVHVAARYNNTGALTLLKKAGANLNALNDIGATPCTQATVSYACDSIAWLGNAGADMNIIDITGMSPLHLAVHCEKLAVIRQLLMHGARLDLRTEKNLYVDTPESTIIPEGSTVFHLVAQPNKNSHAIQRLLLYHALFYPQGTPITPKGLLTFLCCLKKMILRSTKIVPSYYNRSFIIGLKASRQKLLSAYYNQITTTFTRSRVICSLIAWHISG